MTHIKTIAILAAGEGLRIKEINEFKPLVKILGRPMIDRLVSQMSMARPKRFIVAMNTRERQIELKNLPAFSQNKVELFYVDTPSSMHTLYEVMKRAELGDNGHILISMVDTILKDGDFAAYFESAIKLGHSQSSVLVTSFIDDESPLIVELNEQQEVLKFGGPLQEGSVVTSGMYCLSSAVMPHLEDCINNDMKKMRNFLSYLVTQGHTVKAFTIAKTLDVDRPSDVKVAEEFLKS